jgi:alpha-tubulin suppressor-like RCC1 family protein
MPNNFFSQDEDLEEYFVTDYWLIDQYIGDQLWTWGIGQLGTNNTATRSTPVTTFAGGTNWKQVSSGTFHTAAIKTDGTLWVWGGASNGILGTNNTTSRSTPVTTFAGGTNWKQVSCGYHTAAIKTDGTLWTWGSGFDGQLGTNDEISRSTPVTTFAGGTNWKQVSAGRSNTAAIKTDGTLWNWGARAQLGTNDGIGRSTPVPTFAGGTNWKQVSAGFSHAAAIKTDGTLWVWGFNQIFGDTTGGLLGTNDATVRYTPVTTFAGGTNWKQVSLGREHTAAIKTDGTLWTWGSGNFGKLGREFYPPPLTPVTTFTGGTNWADTATGEPEELYTLSAGYKHTAAIKTDGTLWTWGYNSRGQLGTNDKTPNRSTPSTTFAGGTNWKQVSGGNRYTAAIKTDGTLWTWGYNSRGQLGRIVDVLTPVTTFAGGTNWADTSTGEPEELYTLSAGYRTSAAIKTDGTLWTWGSGTNGRLGTNDTTQRNTPVTTFAGGSSWKQVSLADNHTAAIKTDGTLWTWGFGSSGQLGTNDTTDRFTPVTTFAGGTDWKQVSVGSYIFSVGISVENYSHTAAIKTDGTLWVWGYNYYGQLGTNDTTDRFTPVTTFAGGTDWKQVSSGNIHTTAIKTDGTLWVWGYNYGGLGTNDETNRSTPVTTFAGGTNWKQVSSGSFHTAAIKTDGTLWTWGFGSSGQLGTNDIIDRSTPVTTFAGGSSWKQMSAGGAHTAAIKTDGSLWTWGFGGNGTLGTNDTNQRLTPVTTFSGGSSWKQVSSGGYHTVALQDDGVNKELYVFGRLSDGQLGINHQDLTIIPGEVFGEATNWKQISSGRNHTSAIKTDGTLWTWGAGFSGQLGTNDTIVRFIPVTTFAGGTNWKQVSCGYFHTAAVKTDGTLWTWGFGGSGRLGTNNTTTRSTPVTTFAGGTNWKQISVGRDHTAAIKTDGTLWTWGSGSDGRLGTNNTTTRSTPVTTFAGGTNWKQVSCGYRHMSAIKTDGTLWVWGNGSNGSLGTNNTTNRSTPVTTFAGGTNWKQVSGGDRYTVALKDDGVNKELYVFGRPNEGQLGINYLDLEIIPGEVFGEATDWKQVSCSNVHTSAIKTDGTLWTWGLGTNGQLGTNNTISRSTPVTTFAGGTNWKQVSIGRDHTAAIKTGIEIDTQILT